MANGVVRNDHHFSARFHRGGAARLRRLLRRLAHHRNASMSATLLSLVEEELRRVGGR